MNVFRKMLLVVLFVALLLLRSGSKSAPIDHGFALLLVIGTGLCFMMFFDKRKGSMKKSEREAI